MYGRMRANGRLPSLASSMKERSDGYNSQLFGSRGGQWSGFLGFARRTTKPLSTCRVSVSANHIVGSCASVAVPDQSMLEETKVWEIAFFGRQAGLRNSRKQGMYFICSLVISTLSPHRSKYVLMYLYYIIINAFGMVLCWSVPFKLVDPISDGSWIESCCYRTIFHRRASGKMKWTVRIQEWQQFKQLDGQDDLYVWLSTVWFIMIGALDLDIDDFACLIHMCAKCNVGSLLLSWERQLKCVWMCKIGQSLLAYVLHQLLVVWSETWPARSVSWACILGFPCSISFLAKGSFRVHFNECWEKSWLIWIHWLIGLLIWKGQIRE